MTATTTATRYQIRSTRNWNHLGTFTNLRKAVRTAANIMRRNRSAFVVAVIGIRPDGTTYLAAHPYRLERWLFPEAPARPASIRTR